MANIIKLGSLYLDGHPVEMGAEYVPGQTIRMGDTITGKEISWVPVNGMLIADQCLLTYISWKDLDAQGFVFGKEITIQGFRFKIRLLKVGGDEGVSNEWDAALDTAGEDDALWHRDGKYFWGQESARWDASHRMTRGYGSARGFVWRSSGRRYATLGFRPALEPLPTDPAALKHGQQALVVGRIGAVVGGLIDATAYDFVIQPNADWLIGEVDFAANMQDGTLAVDRSRIISIATA